MVDKVGGSNPDEDMSFLEFIRLRERWRTLAEVRLKEEELWEDKGGKREDKEEEVRVKEEELWEVKGGKREDKEEKEEDVEGGKAIGKKEEFKKRRKI